MSELDRFRLDGRVAVVAGGSGGIGVRLCEAFADVGARVVVIGRDRGPRVGARSVAPAATASPSPPTSRARRTPTTRSAPRCRRSAAST